MLDVLIITAVRDEYEAVLQVSEASPEAEWRIASKPDEREVRVRSFKTQNGKLLRVGVSYSQGMGGIAATELAVRLTEEYKPQCLAMCGVLAGRKGKVNQGDVIIADRLWIYDNGKVIAEYDEQKNRKEKILRDILTYNLDTVWKEKAQGFAIPKDTDWLLERPRGYGQQELWLLECLGAGKDPLSLSDRIEKCPDWEQVLERLWEEGHLVQDSLVLTEEGRSRIKKELLLGQGKVREQEPFEIHVAPIATGSPVVEDENIFSDLAESVRKVKGLDMEAAAIGAVHHAYNGRLKKFIVMKGVQDFAAPGKDDHFRDFAARASAECLIRFLRLNLEPYDPYKGFSDIFYPGTQDLEDTALAPSMLLNQSYGVVPFYKKGRRELMDHIEAWADGEESLKGWLFHGLGGIGKTRLFSYLCGLFLTKGWLAGFIYKTMPDSWFERLADDPRHVFMVIDYAGTRGNLTGILKPLFNHSRRLQGRKVRVILLARNTGDWWDNFLSQSDDHKNYLNTTPPHRLEPLASRVEEKEQVFLEARQAFSEKLKMEVKDDIPNLEDPRFDLALYIHMAALMQVKGESTSPDEIMGTTLDHEQRFWCGDEMTSDIQREAWIEDMALPFMTAATLRGGLGKKEDARTLAEALFKGGFSGSDLHRFHRLYELKTGGDTGNIYLDALRPDLLGEALVRRFAGKIEPDDIPAYIAGAFSGAGSAEHQTGFEVLGRAGLGSGDHTEMVTPWIKALLDHNAPESCIPAYLAAMSMGRRGAFSVLAVCLFDYLEKENPKEVASAIEDIGLPNKTVSLSRVALWVTQTLLENLKYEDLEGEERLRKRAGLLNNLGNRQSALGDKDAAMKSALEAVEIRRQLADRHPDAYLPGLALSLNNLGSSQSDLGDKDAALKSAIEAAEVYRRLADRHPDAYLPDLAMSLNNLGLIRSALGDKEAALKSATQAVDVYCRLAERYPDAYLPDLAMSLNNLGLIQRALGDKDASLKSAIEAVEIRRQLADRHPDAYLPNLALSLNNLGNRQSDLGDKEAALKSVRESFHIYWPFFEKYPQAFWENLVIVMKNVIRFSRELEKGIDDFDEEMKKKMTAVVNFRKMQESQH